ncbi:hypothetical protein U1737_07435 [Sphingomonas sp. LB3N6]
MIASSQLRPLDADQADPACERADNQQHDRRERDFLNAQTIEVAGGYMI